MRVFAAALIALSFICSSAFGQHVDLRLIVCRNAKITTGFDGKSIAVPEGARFDVWTKFGPDGTPVSNSRLELATTTRVVMTERAKCIATQAKVVSNDSNAEVSSKWQLEEVGIVGKPLSKGLDEQGMADLIAHINAP